MAGYDIDLECGFQCGLYAFFVYTLPAVFPSIPHTIDCCPESTLDGMNNPHSFVERILCCRATREITHRDGYTK